MYVIHNIKVKNLLFLSFRKDFFFLILFIYFFYGDQCGLYKSKQNKTKKNKTKQNKKKKEKKKERKMEGVRIDIRRVVKILTLGRNK